MSKVSAFIEKEAAKAGIILPWLEGHVTLVTTILKNINTVLENPIVDGVLSVVLPLSVTSRIPLAETYLTKAITDLMTGTAIATDIQNAPTVEAKLTVFLQDIQKYPILKSTIAKDICKKLLAAIDNNTLDAELYSAYLEIEILLNK